MTENVETAIGQIRGLFDRPIVESDNLPNHTIFRVKHKSGQIFTIMRQANYLGTVAQPEVWRKFGADNSGRRETWDQMMQWLHRQASHIEWIRMINPDTTKITQVWPVSKPESEILGFEWENEDWETTSVDGVLYHMQNGNRSLGQVDTLREAQARIAQSIIDPSRMDWDRVNAFTWVPAGHGLEGYKITRTRDGRWG